MKCNLHSPRCGNLANGNRQGDHDTQAAARGGFQGAGRTACSEVQFPFSLPFGSKLGSSLITYSLEPFSSGSDLSASRFLRHDSHDLRCRRGRLRGYRRRLTFLGNAPEDFLAMHRHGPGRRNPQAHLIAFHAEHRDRHFFPDPQNLSDATRQDQQLIVSPLGVWTKGARFRAR
jgi:hypothetical protein